MSKSVYSFIFCIFFCVVIFVSVSRMSGSRAIQISASAPKCVPNEVIVRFKKSIQSDEIRSSIGYLQGKFISYLNVELTPEERDFNSFLHRSFTGDPDSFLIRVPELVGTEQAIAILRANPNVEHVERNILLHPLTVDPYYSNQWALENDGVNGIVYDADIDAPEAWTITTGSSDIIVAVIDNGIDPEQPDLQTALWQNPGENGSCGENCEKSTNNVDDDHNNYTDDSHGWRFGYPVYDPTDPSPSGYDHGTIIAGIIGAAWNDIGIKGICQNVKIMNLNFIDLIGGSISNFINAIYYAIDNGASIISCSQGWRSDDDELNDEDNPYQSFFFEQAIIAAQAKGILFITACGNSDTWGEDKRDADEYYVYPGNYPEDNIINVLATNSSDLLDDCSMYGSTSVDIGAPGVSIFSTLTTILHPYPDNCILIIVIIPIRHIHHSLGALLSQPLM